MPVLKDEAVVNSITHLGARSADVEARTGLR